MALFYYGFLIEPHRVDYTCLAQETLVHGAYSMFCEIMKKLYKGKEKRQGLEGLLSNIAETIHYTTYRHL